MFFKITFTEVMKCRRFFMVDFCLKLTFFIPFRGKISETMFSACQALKVHLSDSTALSSGELVRFVYYIQHWSP